MRITVVSKVRNVIQTNTQIGLSQSIVSCICTLQLVIVFSSRDHFANSL
jgi:hypothetical protein